MSRTIFVNGESLVYVKGPQGSAIAALSELGLAQEQLRITLNPKHEGVALDAWGGEGSPMDIQIMLASVTVTMTLLHYDPDVLEECVRLGMGGSAFGKLGRAGKLMGNGLSRFAAGNNFIGLNVASPVGQRPWRFLYSHTTGPAADYPLGARKSVVTVNWTVVPYTTDPWQGGSGATDYILFDRTLDN